MRGMPHNFCCGDRVFDPVDPRHVGTIREIHSGIWCLIEWRPGFYSHTKLATVKKEDTHANR